MSWFSDLSVSTFMATALTEWTWRRDYFFSTAVSKVTNECSKKPIKQHPADAKAVIAMYKALNLNCAVQRINHI